MISSILTPKSAVEVYCTENRYRKHLDYIYRLILPNARLSSPSLSVHFAGHIAKSGDISAYSIHKLVTITGHTITTLKLMGRTRTSVRRILRTGIEPREREGLFIYPLKRLVVGHEQEVPVRIPTRHPGYPGQGLLAELVHQLCPVHHGADPAEVLCAVVWRHLNVLP